jgi:AraC-like DNA-binding protein
LLELKFKELLFTIFTEPGNAGLLSYVASIADQYKTPIREIMEANFMFHLSVAEFARMAGRSLTTFKKDFYKEYHTSPGKWLTEKRLEFAKLLLETSNDPVGEIALQSGFENISHFSRVFKEKHATSPNQYRKSLTSPTGNS